MIEQYGYVLEGRTVRPATSFEDWERGYANRRVAKTEVAPGVIVSTVFLAWDQNIRHFGPPADGGKKITPILFQTKVLGGPLDGEIAEYATIDEAEKGHQEMVDFINGVDGDKSWADENAPAPETNNEQPS